MSSFPLPLPGWITGKPFYGRVDAHGRVLVRKSSYFTPYQWASWLDARVEPSERGARLVGRFRLSYMGLFITLLWLAVVVIFGVTGAFGQFKDGLIVAAVMVAIFVATRIVARRQEPEVVRSIASMDKAAYQPDDGIVL